MAVPAGAVLPSQVDGDDAGGHARRRTAARAAGAGQPAAGQARGDQRGPVAPGGARRRRDPRPGRAGAAPPASAADSGDPALCRPARLERESSCVRCRMRRPSTVAAPCRTAAAVACTPSQQGSPRLPAARRLLQAASDGARSEAERLLVKLLREAASPAGRRTTRSADTRSMSHFRAEGRDRGRRLGVPQRPRKTFRTTASARTPSRCSAGKCCGSRGWT